ncbi:hypothetical protein ACJZ2D_009257 [Fusarium nematophilum]
MPPQSVVIVRAGVLGLTTAAVLQDNHLRLRITIVAAEVPLVPPFPEAPRPSPEYASMWAGAHFHPDGQSNDEHQLVLHTAGVMRRLARRSPEPGVQSVIGRAITEYTPNSKAHMRTGDVYACAESDDFRIPGTQERNPGGEWGCEYQAWIANVHIYCRWLLTHFIRQGGDKIQKRLSTLEEAFQVVESSSSCPPLVINCSGRNFDTDPRCKVIRGQTVLVRNAYHKTATRHNKDDSWSFLIPRPLGGGGTIVGGTKQMGDWGTDIRPQETRAILEAAARYWPTLCPKWKISRLSLSMMVAGLGGTVVSGSNERSLGMAGLSFTGMV